MRQPIAAQGEYLVVARNVPLKIDWQDMKDHIRPHLVDAAVDYTEVIQSPNSREKFAAVIARTEQDACQVYQILCNCAIESHKLLAQWFKATAAIVNSEQVQRLLAEVAPYIVEAPTVSTVAHSSELVRWPQNPCKDFLAPQTYSDHRCHYCAPDMQQYLGIIPGQYTPGYAVYRFNPPIVAVSSVQYPQHSLSGRDPIMTPQYRSSSTPQVSQAQLSQQQPRKSATLKNAGILVGKRTQQPGQKSADSVLRPPIIDGSVPVTSKDWRRW